MGGTGEEAPPQRTAALWFEPVSGWILVLGTLRVGALSPQGSVVEEGEQGGC